MNSKKQESGKDVCAYSGPLKYCTQCEQAFMAGVKHVGRVTSTAVEAAQNKVERAREELNQAITELAAVKEAALQKDNS